MKNLQKVLLNLTKDEFILLIDALDLYKIALSYLNYVDTIDECNCFIDILLYNININSNGELETSFFFDKTDIFLTLKALTLYKKALSLLEEKEMIKITNTIALKLKNISLEEIEE